MNPNNKKQIDYIQDVVANVLTEMTEAEDVKGIEEVRHLLFSMICGIDHVLAMANKCENIQEAVDKVAIELIADRVKSKIKED